MYDCKKARKNIDVFWSQLIFLCKGSIVQNCEISVGSKFITLKITSYQITLKFTRIPKQIIL